MSSFFFVAISAALTVPTGGSVFFGFWIPPREAMYSSSTDRSDGRRMIFSMPLPAADTPPCENKCDDAGSRAVRILGRRYALTATDFKFLAIGIKVDPPSYVEIVIGDHRGRELILSLETWKGLYEQRHNIHALLHTDAPDAYSFISVGPLTVRVHTINAARLISLESSTNVRMMMVEKTLQRMFDLDPCIDISYDRLVRILATVDVKYTQFANIASTALDGKEAANVIRASDVFNRQQLIDCELAALVFSS